MKKSILPLGAIALASSLLMACNDEEELVPQMEQAKPAVQAAAPKSKPEEPAKTEEPELVPIQSLSGDNATESAEENSVEAAAPTGDARQLDKGDYVIQVSIQSSKKAADGIVRKLAENNIKAYVAEVENPGELEGTYYRIRVGYFESSASAQEFGKQVLSSLNFAWWIDLSRNDDVGNPGGSDTAYDSDDSYSDNYSEPEPAPAPAPAPAPEPEPEPEPEPAPAPAPAPAPEPEAAPTADTFDDWD